VGIYVAPIVYHRGERTTSRERKGPTNPPFDCQNGKAVDGGFAAARLPHIAGTNRSAKHYLNTNKELDSIR
jgi:hypothetical protein